MLLDHQPQRNQEGYNQRVSGGRSVFNTSSDGGNGRGHEYPDKITERIARDDGLCDEVGIRD